jgi:predicted PurR-regulated permease PerM
MSTHRDGVAEPHHPGRGVGKVHYIALLGLMLSAALALGWIVLPFYGSILWGAVIALTFAPLNRHLLPRTGGRPSLAAMLTLLVAVLLGVLPLALVVALLASEATTVYTRLQSGEWQPAAYLRHLFHALPESVITWLGRMGWGDFDTVQQHVTSGLTRASRFFAGQALGMGQDTVRFVTGVFIALYLAFFLIRDGQALARAARLSMPLAADHQRELLDKFGTVIRATVKGNLLVAALQGLLGGLAFWALGVSAPLLWGVSMAFLSLVPAVGAALVWAPVALYFLLAGATWKAVMLTVFGVLVIGLIDNLLRPVLVGKDTRLPDYVVLITTLGGMAVMGINGFVLGPAIAAMFIALWHLHGQTLASLRRHDEDKTGTA